MTVHRAVRVANLPRELCHMMLGDQHKTSHRMVVGFVVMTAGVLVAKQAHHMPYEALATLTDLTGYGVHALGATPFIEWLLGAEKTAEAVVEAASE